MHSKVTAGVIADTSPMRPRSIPRRSGSAIARIAKSYPEHVGDVRAEERDFEDLHQDCGERKEPLARVLPACRWVKK
jgi:hypothetical protein